MSTEDVSASHGPRLSSVWAVNQRHTGIYTGGKAVLSSDGIQLICWCSEDIKVVEVATGAVVRTFDGSDDGFTAFGVSPDDTRIVTAQRSGLMRSWNLGTGEEERHWRGHSLPVTDISFDPSGLLVASGSVDRTVRVWKVSDGFNCTHNFRGHEAMVMRLRWHPNSDRLELFSCSDDHTVRCWNLRTGQGRALKNHLSATTDVAFLGDDTLISVSRDKVANVWSLRNYSHVKTILTYESLECVHLLPESFEFPDSHNHEGPFLAIGGVNGTIRIYSATTWKPVHTQAETATNHAIRSFLATADQLVTVTSDHNFHFFSFGSGAAQREELDRSRLLVGFNDEIIDVQWCPDNRHAVVATNSEQVRIVDTETLSWSLLCGHTDIVLCSAVSADGRFVVTGSKDNTVRVWDLTTHKCMATLQGHTDSVGAVACSRRLGASGSDSQFFVSGSKDRTIKVWNAMDSGDDSDDSKSGVTARVSAIAHDKDINCIRVAPNNKVLATAGQDKTIKLWSTGDLQTLGVMRGHRRGVWCVEFSPIDKILASASGDKTIKIWSLSDFSCLKTFEGHQASVLGCSFVCQGMQLVSAGADGLLKLWTIKTNECVNTFDEHEDKVWALAVSQDGQKVITGGVDSALCVWEDRTVQEEEKALQDKHDSQLKEQDLSNFLRKGQLGDALHLALDMDKPRATLKVLFAATDQANNKKQSNDELSDVDDQSCHQNLCAYVSQLNMELVSRLLLFIRDWNTNAKNAAVSHATLHALFTSFTPSSLARCPRIKEVLSALVPYSERHFQRLDALLRKSFLTDFLFDSMAIASGDKLKLQAQVEDDPQDTPDTHDTSPTPEPVESSPVVSSKKRKTRQDDGGLKKSTQNKKNKKAV